MTINQTGRLIKDNDYIQYFGYLCYLKNPNVIRSEVSHCLSNKAFAKPGYTGCQITVDPINQVYSFIGGNKCHNKITYIHPTRMQEIITENNKKRMLLMEISLLIPLNIFLKELN